MKKKTPNGERLTFNIEWLGVRENEGRYASKASTFNAQLSTPNVQRASKSRFDLEQRLLEFSGRIIRLVDALPNTRAANHVAGQLLRCGTSSYGNLGEVEAAESRKDFVHKLKILPQGTERDSPLATIDRQIGDASCAENGRDSQRD
jgi:hypothetical protein